MSDLLAVVVVGPLAVAGPSRTVRTSATMRAMFFSLNALSSYFLKSGNVPELVEKNY